VRRLRDALTLELFAVPQPQPAVAAGLDLDAAIRDALSDAIKHCDSDRHQVAAEMSRLTGREISKFMLDAYTGDSRQDHHFPLRYAAAFEAATGSYCLTQLLAKARGCKVLVGDEAVLAELGRLDQMEGEIKAQRAALKNYLEKRKP
jgi:hypothetical protein